VKQVAKEAGLSDDNELRVGAGITTGPVTISLLKAGNQLQYTVLGDPVRRAHKLQAQSDAVGSNILLDEESYLSVRDLVFCHRHTDEDGSHFYTTVYS
jgi:class 3 adenylate cyclase